MCLPMAAMLPPLMLPLATQTALSPRPEAQRCVLTTRILSSLVWCAFDFLACKQYPLLRVCGTIKVLPADRLRCFKRHDNSNQGCTHAASSLPLSAYATKPCCEPVQLLFCMVCIHAPPAWAGLHGILHAPRRPLPSCVMQLGSLVRQGRIDLLQARPQGATLVFGQPFVLGDVLNPAPWAVTAINASFADPSDDLRYYFLNSTIWCAESPAAGAPALQRAQHAAKVDGPYDFTNRAPVAPGAGWEAATNELEDAARGENGSGGGGDRGLGGGAVAGIVVGAVGALPAVSFSYRSAICTAQTTANGSSLT